MFKCTCTVHSGALFPKHAVWLYPVLSFIIAVFFMFFIRLLVIGCDLNYLLLQLWRHADECGMHTCYVKCCSRDHKGCRCCARCCLRSNAMEGLKCRIHICTLIFVRPVVSWVSVGCGAQCAMGTPSGMVLLLVTIICTVIPMQYIKIIERTVRVKSID